MGRGEGGKWGGEARGNPVHDFVLLAGLQSFPYFLVFVLISLPYCYFAVHPDAMPDYEGVDLSDPNCVVLADATDAFTYQSLNGAFRVLVDQQDGAEGSGGGGGLISLGSG